MNCLIHLSGQAVAAEWQGLLFPSLCLVYIYDIIYFIVVIGCYLLLLFNCSRYLYFKTNPLHQICLVHWSGQGMIGERQALLFPSHLL